MTDKKIPIGTMMTGTFAVALEALRQLPPGESLDPACILFTPAFGPVLLPLDPSSVEKSVPLIRETLRRTDAYGYVVASEAWAAIYPIEDDPRSIALQPNEREDRFEILSLHGETDDGAERSRCWQITRDEGGRVVELAALPIRTEDPTRTFGGLLRRVQ